jgi:hypothetical protein
LIAAARMSTDKVEARVIIEGAFDQIGSVLAAAPHHKDRAAKG